MTKIDAPQVKIAAAAIPPQNLLEALAARKGRYTQAHSLYHCIWFDADSYCGVFGEGDWANYEWFIWRAGKLETSDAGYGIIEVALRDVLNQVVPK